MGRISLAFKYFFRVLFDGDFAGQAQVFYERPALESPVPQTAPSVIAAPPPRARPVARSEAMSLLSVLQREGRLVDFLKEDLAGYSDAQIGSAARDVHRDCSAALERMFAIRPLRSEGEGSSIRVDAGFDATRIRLSGNVAGTLPVNGTLRHAGWQATKVELPEWTGGEEGVRVVAPAEVEL